MTGNATGLVVTVNDDTPIRGAISSGTVDEDGLPGGIAGGTDDFIDPNTDGDSDETTVTGTIAGLPQFQSGADEPLSFSLVTDTSALEAQNLTSGGVALTYSLVGNVLTATAGPGGATVFTFTLNPGGAWVFDLEDQLDHAPGAAENDLTIFLGSQIRATDFDGDIAPGGAVQITVNDDTPTAIADINSGIEGGLVTGNVLTGATADVFGADGATVPGGGVVGVRAEAGDATTDVVTGTGSPITGLYGTLTLNADGCYSYDGDPNVVPPAGATDVFVYTIKDGDGDLSTTTLTITLTDSGIIAPADSDVTVNENALDTNALPDGSDLAVGTVTGSLPGSSAETDATNQLNGRAARRR